MMEKKEHEQKTKKMFSQRFLMQNTSKNRAKDIISNLAIVKW